MRSNFESDFQGNTAFTRLSHYSTVHVLEVAGLCDADFLGTDEGGTIVGTGSPWAFLCLTQYSRLFLTLGTRFLFGLGGIFGVWLLTFPAFVSEPCDGIS
jgi:hypothetical protein